MRYDKYFKEDKGLYVDLFLYILKRYFIIFIVRLLIRKKILSKRII